MRPNNPAQLRVLISTSSFATTSQKPLEVLREHNVDIVRNPYGRPLTRPELIALGGDCVGVVAGLEPYDRTVIDVMTQLRCISRCGVGTDNIDMPYALKRGIKIKLTSDAPTRAVAELTLGLIFALLRGIAFVDRELRAGRWVKHTGNLLAGKTVGIIGLGRIGCEMARLLNTFGVSIIGFDPVKLVSSPNSLNVKLHTFEEVLSRSDILCIHAAAESGQKPLFDAAAFKLLKKGSYFVNTSRGSLVDEEQLYMALSEKRLSGAALDVFQQEPYDGPLKNLGNVVLTTHIGSYTKETREKMEFAAVENLMSVIMKEPI